MHLMLVLLIMSISLQASDQEPGIIKKLDASFDTLISADYPLFDVDRDDQIILPVSYGQYITLPLQTEDTFAFDSISNMIKETQESDDFYILASYRSRQPDGRASYIKCARAAGFIKYIATGKTEDPLTRLPIVKVDFHEFCYINKKLAVRYLGSHKQLRYPINILQCTTGNSLQNSFGPSTSMGLALLHTRRGDFGRAQKYIQTISEEYAKEHPKGIWHMTNFAIQKKHNYVAVQALNKISSCDMHAPLLLYKLNNNTDQESLHALSTQIVNQGTSQAYFHLGHLYIQEALKIDLQSDMGKKFLAAAGVHYAKAAQKDNNALTACAFLQFLGLLGSQQDQLHFASLQELESYSNVCIDVINSGDPAHEVVRMKETYPRDYQVVMKLLKKYGTKKLLND